MLERSNMKNFDPKKIMKMKYADTVKYRQLAIWTETKNKLPKCFV
jgi:hypothetical protein